MKKTIAAYGLAENQFASMISELPEDYKLHISETITDLLVADAVCYIIDSEALDEDGVNILQNYYIDAEDYVSEQIVWIGENPPCKSFACYVSFEKLFAEMGSIVEKAQHRYDIYAMYCGEYATLPARFIADSLEQDVLCALYRKYGEKPDQAILKRMRREWEELLEAEATQELAAVYELTLWLRKNKQPYWIGGHAPSGFVPYLLGITRVNPLPPELGGQNLVWQEFCGYGRAPLYEIHLSADLRPRVIEWLKDHWLSKVNHYEWKDFQPYEPSCIRRGNMYFRFDLDDHSITETCDPSKLCREDIFYYLKKHGFIDKDAFRGMCSVRKGKGFPVITTEMRMAEDNWFLKECENVRWLPSRAQLLEQCYFETQLQPL